MGYSLDSRMAEAYKPRPHQAQRDRALAARQCARSARAINQRPAKP